ncbi:hypothetical protein DFH09DRAFT_1099249 [Mycena vulgaris]|nr:hypothetical protein DFH09DRAFT_1099249 [Mycena vulgaris]
MDRIKDPEEIDILCVSPYFESLTNTLMKKHPTSSATSLGAHLGWLPEDLVCRRWDEHIGTYAEVATVRLKIFGPNAVVDGAIPGGNIPPLMRICHPDRHPWLERFMESKYSPDLLREAGWILRAGWAGKEPVRLRCWRSKPPVRVVECEDYDDEMSEDEDEGEDTPNLPARGISDYEVRATILRVFVKNKKITQLRVPDVPVFPYLVNCYPYYIPNTVTWAMFNIATSRAQIEPRITSTCQLAMKCVAPSPNLTPPISAIFATSVGGLHPVLLFCLKILRGCGKRSHFFRRPSHSPPPKETSLLRLPMLPGDGQAPHGKTNESHDDPNDRDDHDRPTDVPAALRLKDQEV